MKFQFIDKVIEVDEKRIVASKRVDPADEYLRDHFPTFPIMPGVLMLETMVQAASTLLAKDQERLVLGGVKAVKYGAMVRPGDTLSVEVEMTKLNEDGSTTCKGKGTVTRHDSNESFTAVSGRFTMRPAKLK